MEINPHQTLTLGQLAGRRVKEIRKGRGLSQRALAARLKAIGHPIDHTMLGRIERGKTLGQLDHLAALAAALEVAPAHLLAPGDDVTNLKVAPKLPAIPGRDARQWVRGTATLLGGDPVAFLTGLPEEERRALMKSYLTRGVSPIVRAVMDQDKLDELADDRLWEVTEGEAIREAERKKKGDNDG